MIFLSISAFAQSKLDAAARTLTDPAEMNTFIVEFDGNIDYGDVNVEELTRTGSTTIICANLGQINRLAALPQVTRISLGNRANTIASTNEKQTSQNWFQRLWSKIKSIF